MKKERKAFEFHFGFFTPICKYPMGGRGEELCISSGHWKPGLNDSIEDLEY